MPSPTSRWTGTLAIKPVTGKITWDLGVIYYSYPNGSRFGVNALGVTDKRNYDYFELKVGASGDIWKDGTVGVTVFYSPDYQYQAGNVWTAGFPLLRHQHREVAPPHHCDLQHEPLRLQSALRGDLEVHLLS